ncbi:MAG: pantoate--beta-alanine ligase [Calditrichaeota bacterium]|nr:pantoate--beta-alanine ligase [Calditrichota bacterium]
MSAYSAALRQKGIRVGLVPTMGFLHEGHLSLFQLLEGRCDLKVASIFVNPIQFGAGEDLNKYPRDETQDLELLEGAGCELVFVPSSSEMYPPYFQTYVSVEELSKPLCGRFRPLYFQGVATVVLRLFNITNCSVAAFGLKDYQQARVIEQMTHDLNLSVELVFGETVRESNGLAMSSRNKYLSREDAELAALIPKSLEWAKAQAVSGVSKCVEIIVGMRKILESRSGIEIQYIETVDPVTLESREDVGDGVRVLLAVYIGKTRLIDNVRIKPFSEIA